jgi:nitrogen regulatory protein PII
MSAPGPMKLITCILPPGIALGVLEKLRDEQGVHEGSVHGARGVGKLTPLAYRRLRTQTEKEVLKVVVPAGRSDELFAWIFEHAQIDRPHGGIMFMSALHRSTVFLLPELATVE